MTRIVTSQLPLFVAVARAQSSRFWRCAVQAIDFGSSLGFEVNVKIRRVACL
jgi:hypothetical protein